MSSLQAVLQAVDPYKVADIFGGVWVGISGCIAAAVAPSTQVFTFGMNMGDKIASVCNAALENAFQQAGGAAVTDDVRKWQTFSVDLVCHTVAVASTFYAQVRNSNSQSNSNSNSNGTSTILHGRTHEDLYFTSKGRERAFEECFALIALE